MTIIDRPLARHRATKTTSLLEPAAFSPLGGRYVTTTSAQSYTEGSYVSTGSLTAPAHRGTYVSTSSPATRHGGSYTYAG